MVFNIESWIIVDHRKGLICKCLPISQPGLGSLKFEFPPHKIVCGKNPAHASASWNRPKNNHYGRMTSTRIHTTHRHAVSSPDDRFTWHWYLLGHQLHVCTIQGHLAMVFSDLCPWLISFSTEVFVDPVPVVACEWRAVGPLWLGCSVQLIQVALPAFVLAPIHLTEMEEHVNFIKKKYTYLISTTVLVENLRNIWRNLKFL
jgi:hypothetical protein